MKTRSFITLVLSFVVNATVFGTLGIIVLSVPALREHVIYTLPAAIVISILITPFISWALAPRMRARFWNPDLKRHYRHF